MDKTPTKEFSKKKELESLPIRGNKWIQTHRHLGDKHESVGWMHR